MNLEGAKIDTELKNLDISDQWILTKMDALIEKVTDNLEKFEFGLAAGNAYEFAWSEFCDWYIEMAKPRLYGENEADKATANGVLLKVLTSILKLLHPIMPFITEEIYTSLPDCDKTIMTAEWPKHGLYRFEKETQAMESVMELIRQIRNIRAEMNVGPGKKAKLLLKTTGDKKASAKSMRSVSNQAGLCH